MSCSINATIYARYEKFEKDYLGFECKGFQKQFLLFYIEYEIVSLYLFEDVSSSASSIWLAMAGKPPKGADKILPPWISEFFCTSIPDEELYDPWVGDENRVGSNGCSLPWSCCCVAGPILEALLELLWPGLGSLKLVNTAWGEKLSLWLPLDPPALEPENYHKNWKMGVNVIVIFIGHVVSLVM